MFRKSRSQRQKVSLFRKITVQQKYSHFASFTTQTLTLSIQLHLHFSRTKTSQGYIKDTSLNVSQNKNVFFSNSLQDRWRKYCFTNVNRHGKMKTKTYNNHIRFKKITHPKTTIVSMHTKKHLVFTQGPRNDPPPLHHQKTT